MNNSNEVRIDERYMDLLLYKFKTYLGSVSREIINRQLEEIPYTGD